VQFNQKCLNYWNIFRYWSLPSSDKQLLPLCCNNSLFAANSNNIVSVMSCWSTWSIYGPCYLKSRYWRFCDRLQEHAVNSMLLNQWRAYQTTHIKEQNIILNIVFVYSMFFVKCSNYATLNNTAKHILNKGSWIWKYEIRLCLFNNFDSLGIVGWTWG
jgi:hypothetical protein